MKRMLRWRIRRCIASLLAFAMTCPLGYGPVARALVPSAEAASARQQSVVVFEFQNKSNEGGEGLARAITRQIRLVMDQSPTYDLVTYTTAPPHNPSIERALKEGQLTEQELTGVAEPATAVKIAQILGAEYALLGEIDEDGYEYNAEQKRVTIKLMAYLYSTATGQPVNSVTVQGEGTGEGMKGALEERARLDVAQRLERKLSGRPEPTEGGKSRPTMRKWLPWVLGGLAVGILAVALLGKKSKKGPAAPGAVTVTGTATGIRLAWAPSPGAESYRIYRATVGSTNVSGLSYQMIAEVPAGVLQYDDNPTALPANAWYSYQVAAIAGGQEGSRMAGDRQIGPGEPAPVRNLQATVNNRTILVSWEPSPEDFVRSYRVYRSTQLSEWDASDYRVVTAPAHSYTDSGLAGGQTYFYKVSAVGENGRESNWRDQAAVARPTGTQPSAPTSVDAQPVQDASKPTVRITWRATGEPDVTSYEVLRGMSRVRGMAPPGYGILWNKAGKGGASRGGPFQQIGTVTAAPSGTMEWLDSNGLQYDTTYFYAVRAVTNQGPSPNSEVVSATPNSQPRIVTNVTAIAGDRRVTVKWSPLSEPDLVGYNVYRQTGDQAMSRVKITDTPVTGLQYVDTTVQNDQTYQYFVRAIDVSNWEGPLSLPAVVTPTAPPEGPRNVRAAAGNYQVTVLWDKNTESNIARYNVYRSDSPTMTPVFLAAVPATPADPATIMYVDDGSAQSSSQPQNGMTYYYQVTAVNNSGVESARSPADRPVSAMPDIPPAAPQNVQVTGGDRSVTITWSPVTRLADPDGRLLTDVGRTLRGYRVYRAVASGSNVLDDVRTLVEDLPLASLAGQPRYEDRKAPTGIGLRYSVTATMLDNSGGILESAVGRPLSATPVVVVRRLTPPQNFQGVADDNAVHFSWTASTDPSALGYVIYGSESQSGPYVALFTAVNNSGLPTLPATTTSYDLVASTGLPIQLRNDVRFWFKIAAVDKLGVEGTQSSEIQVIPNPRPPVPLEVASYNTSATGAVLDMAVRVTWKMPTDTGGRAIYGYRVYRSTSATGPFERITSDGAEETGLISATPVFYDRFRTGSVSLPEANSQDFYYQVRTLVQYPVAGVVESAPSNTAGPTRVINIPPGKVQNVRLAETNGIVTVRWDALLDPVTNTAVTDLARYTIGRRVKGDTTGAEVFFPVGSDVLQYYDTDVVRGQTYIYRVQGVDFINPGPWSDEKEITVSQ